jgi:hypothetical protein
MAKQTINTGTIANDGTGDTIRDGGIKINENFTELYGATGTLQSDVLALNGGGITAIVKLTQAAYDALDPVSATTLYVIVG